MLLPVTYLSPCAQEKEETVLVFFWVFLGWKVFPLIYDFFGIGIMRNVIALILFVDRVLYVISLQLYCVDFSFFFFVDFNVFLIMSNL